MRLTLGAAKQHLQSYAQTEELLVARLNFAIEALVNRLPTLDKIAVEVTDGRITLPSEYLTLAGVTLDTVPNPIRGRWYEFVSGGNGTEETSALGADDMGDGFVVFKDLSEVDAAGCYLKVLCDLDETPDVRFFGLDEDDEQVLTEYAGETISGEIVQGSSTGVWSDTKFKSLTQVVKDTTSGRVRIYASATSGDSDPVLVAIYHPWDTSICLRRYRVDADVEEVVALCQRRFVYLKDDSDVLPVSNLGALRDALESENFNEQGDLDRAEYYMSRAIEKINNEHSRKHPATSYPPMVTFRDLGGGIDNLL